MNLPGDTATLDEPLGHEPRAGASSRAQAEAWLAERLHEVAAYDKRTASQCVRAIVEACDLEIAEPEVVESLYFLASGHPKLAEKHGLSASELGRRLAQDLEQEGESERAIVVLQRAAAQCPDSRAIERELAGVMRRAGLASELVDRYLDRSRALLEKGRPLEAIPWLQEVLLVDRSRRDVARLIRDLRYQDVESAARTRQRQRLFVLGLVLTGLAALVGMRELTLHGRYRELTGAQPQGIDQWRERLEAVEAFATAHPVWHRALDVRSDVLDLRAHVRQLEDAAAAAVAREREITEQRRFQADRARDVGTAQAEAGHFESALRHFEEALELGGAGWPAREQTERDVLAIRKWLEGSE